MLTAQTVKFFADGVIENETGALLAPYCGSLHDHGGLGAPPARRAGGERSDPGNNRGMQVWDDLAGAARAVDELGFQIHIHAIGDAAARQALDAIEHVVATNGPRDRRPVIAHAQLVDDADIDRFAELGVIANMQPLWAQLDPLMVELTVPRLGVERAEKQYRMHSLDESGARLSFGSDWPVSSGAPLDGIAVAVSRQTAEGVPQGGWTPQEILPIEPCPWRVHLGRRAPGLRGGEMGRNRARRERRPGVVGPRPAHHAASGDPGDPGARDLPGRKAGLFDQGMKGLAMSTTSPDSPAATPPPALPGEGSCVGRSACPHSCCSEWSTWCRSRCSPPTASSPS